MFSEMFMAFISMYYRNRSDIATINERPIGQTSLSILISLFQVM